MTHTNDMSNSKMKILKQKQILKQVQDGVVQDDTKSKILHRLQIARGHLDKVISMVENGAYCIDVVHQSIAVQAALKKTDEVVLEDHLKTCVSDSIKAGKSTEAIKEVMEVLRKK